MNFPLASFMLSSTQRNFSFMKPMHSVVLDSYKEHFKEALNNYESILVILDQFELELPYDDNESFPENWPEDPMVLLGQYLEILELIETEEDEFRCSVNDLVESNGAKWFWGNRMRLAAEIEF
ncbi:MAG: hypothetical protein ABSE95_05280 [Thermodesulfobacteriota bacterium]